MSQAISEKLNPSRISREPFGHKAEKTLHRVTFTPSSAQPEETLNVYLPKLSENMVYVPGSLGLTFNITQPSGKHANNRFVNNLSRNLISRMRISYGGEVLQDLNRFDIYATYKDMFLMKDQRENMLREGISSVNMHKLRAGAGDKVTTDAAEVNLAAIYNTKYRLAINHPILDSHGIFYAKGLSSNLLFEITLAQSKDVVITSDSTKSYNYSLTNIELEYECINSEMLAKQVQSEYQVGKGFYFENILLHKQFQITRNTDSVINEHINIPRRSMSGILLLFTEPYDAGARDSEKFVYPNLTGVNFNIDGLPNKLYSKGMTKTDFWKSATSKFGLCDNMKQKDFYSDKFCLWVDLRPYSDDSIHGNGLRLNSTKDGIKLELKRDTTGSGKLNCYLFVISDAAMEVQNSDLKAIMY